MNPHPVIAFQPLHEVVNELLAKIAPKAGSLLFNGVGEMSLRYFIYADGISTKVEKVLRDKGESIESICFAIIWSSTKAFVVEVSG